MSNLSDSYWVRGSRAPPVSYTGCRSSSAGGCGCIAPQQDTRTLSLLECLYPHSQKRAVWIWPKTSITTSLHLKLFFVCKMLDYNLVDKMIRTLEFSPAKNGFKSVISIFCCSVSVGNISFHFQTCIFVINCNNPVNVWQQPVLHTEMWLSSSLSGMTWRNNKLRQTKSRRTVIYSVSVYCFFMSFQTDWMMIRSDLCVEQTKITGLLQLMTKSMFGNENWYFLLTHYSKI